MATQKTEAEKAKAKAKRNAARKQARANKKQQKREDTSRTTTEKKGVGNQTHPENLRVPEDAIIKREAATETGTKVTTSPEVMGDKTLQIIDIRNSRPVHVSILEGTGLTKDTDGRVLVVTNNVSTNVVPLVNARGLFAVKKDGTVIYNDRGFDDVPTNAEFDLLDIEKLIAHNN